MNVCVFENKAMPQEIRDSLLKRKGIFISMVVEVAENVYSGVNRGQLV